MCYEFCSLVVFTPGPRKTGFENPGPDQTKSGPDSGPDHGPDP